MAATQSKNGRRFDEEFKREVAALASRPGATDELGGPAMKIGVIKPLAGQHSVRKLCRTLGVARSAYYAAAKKPARPGQRAAGREDGRAL